jgi:hypothetical protein
MMDSRRRNSGFSTWLFAETYLSSVITKKLAVKRCRRRGNIGTRRGPVEEDSCRTNRDARNEVRKISRDVDGHDPPRASQDPLVVLEPILVVVPGAFGKGEIHYSMRSWEIVCPSLASRIDCARWRAMTIVSISLPFRSKEPLPEILVLYSAAGNSLVFVEAEDDLRMVVGDALEGGKLAFLRCGGLKGQTHLDVHPSFLAFGNEVDLPVVKFADRNTIPAVEKLQEHDVFNDATDITVSVSEKPVTKSDVAHVVLLVQL